MRSREWSARREGLARRHPSRAARLGAGVHARAGDRAPPDRQGHGALARPRPRARARPHRVRGAGVARARGRDGWPRPSQGSRSTAPTPSAAGGCCVSSARSTGSPRPPRANTTGGPAVRSSHVRPSRHVRRRIGHGSRENRDPLAEAERLRGFASAVQAQFLPSLCRSPVENGSDPQSLEHTGARCEDERRGQREG